ncbi:MAG TPA: LptE family protein [Sphingobacteriaceae bacterium]|jgi:hypothetical protein|nr:LptE family protein [Sphingobacteriaceae bacterium]
MKKYNSFLIIVGLLFISACGIRYSFSGGSIPADMKTVTVHFIENQAAIVYPILSETLTERLKARIRSQSRLSQVSSDGDGIFEGTITNYTIGPAAVEAGTDRAALNRLTITVNIKYTNSVQPDDSFELPFSRYKDFSSASQPIQAQEEQIVKDIVEMLTEDIYNRAFANW